MVSVRIRASCDWCGRVEKLWARLRWSSREQTTHIEDTLPYGWVSRRLEDGELGCACQHCDRKLASRALGQL